MTNLIIPQRLRETFYKTLFKVREEPIPFLINQDIQSNLIGANERKLVEVDGTNITGFKAIIDDTNHKMVSIVSDKYKTFLNTTLVQMIDEMANYLDMQVMLKEASIFGGSRTKYVFSFEDYKMNVGGEAMIPRITILNSYGGENRLKVIGGAYVLVCSNGMMMNKVIDDFSKVHSGGINAIEDFGKAVENVIENTLKAANEHFPLFKQKRITEDSIVSTMEYFPKSTEENWIG